MRKILTLFLAGLLAIILLGCSARVQVYSETPLLAGEVSALREKYPAYSTVPAMASVITPTLESTHYVASHVVLLEIVKKGESTMIDANAPGGIYYESNQKQKELGYEVSDKPEYIELPHYAIKVEKVLWLNSLKVAIEKDGGPKVKPIEEGKEYTMMADMFQSTVMENMKPGQKLVMPVVWGAEGTSFDGYLTLGLDFAYYLTEEGHLLSVSSTSECKEFDGYTLADYAKEVETRVGPTYFDKMIEDFKKVSEAETQTSYDPNMPTPTPSPAPTAKE